MIVVDLKIKNIISIYVFMVLMLKNTYISIIITKSWKHCSIQIKLEFFEGFSFFYSGDDTTDPVEESMVIPELPFALELIIISRVPGTTGTANFEWEDGKTDCTPTDDCRPCVTSCSFSFLNCCLVEY